MEAVRQEVGTTPPLVFPWRPALPGLIALVVVFSVAIWIGIGAPNDPSARAVFERQLNAIHMFVTRSETQWTAVAVVITILSGVLPWRFMRGQM